MEALLDHPQSPLTQASPRRHNAGEAVRVAGACGKTPFLWEQYWPDSQPDRDPPPIIHALVLPCRETDLSEIAVLLYFKNLLVYNSILTVQSAQSLQNQSRFPHLLFAKSRSAQTHPI